MALKYARNASGTINLTLTTDAGTDSPVAIGSGSEEGLKRITGFSGKPASAFYEVKLTGDLEQVDDFRVDLRPVRRGVGV